MLFRKLKPRFVVAYGPFKWFLESNGYAGITMPWFSIYVLEEWLQNPELRTHELVHIAQMKRDGPVIMSIRYLYFLYRVGYFNNPYEIEARRITRLLHR